MSAEAEAKLFLVEEASPLWDQEPASSTSVTEEPASSTPVTEKPVSSPVNEECGQKMHPDEQDKQVVEQGGE